MARLPKDQDVRESPTASQDWLSGSALLLLDKGGNAIEFNAQAISLGLVPADAQKPVPAPRLPSFVADAPRELRDTPASSLSYQTVWARAGQLPSHFQVDLLSLPARTDLTDPPSCLASVRLLEAGEIAGDGPLDAENPRPWYAARAHEIKNSLVAVRTLVELILEKQPGLGIAQIVRQEIARINSLVGQMLKPMAQEESRSEWVNPQRIVESVMQVTEPQLRDRAIQLHLSLGAGEQEIWGDPQQIEQAVLNLVINALEAMIGSGDLKVRTFLREQELTLARTAEVDPHRAYVIAVSDNGCGIAPEHLDRLFEESFTTKRGGTGLGLAITRQIMQVHCGTIEVKSELSQGTTFELCFPVRKRDIKLGT